MKKSPNIDEVILIDDDPIQHLICERMLKLLYNKLPIKKFYNGLEAISYLEDRDTSQLKSSKALIFLDLNMPIMDGFEFLWKYQFLKKENRGNDYLIVLSSTILKSEKLVAIDFSVLQGYYEKPLRLETLKVILDGFQSN